MARLLDLAEGVIALDVGLRLGYQRQRLRRHYRRRVHRLSVDQAMQQIQDVRLGGCTGLQRQFDGGEHSLLIMLKNEGQDVDHFAVAAWHFEYTLLQSLEGGRQFSEGGAVAQGPGLALDDSQIVPPVVDRHAFAMTRADEEPLMLADYLTFGDNDDALGIHPKAHWPIGERRRYAVAIALQMDEAGRRHALGVFDKAVERSGNLHQASDLLRPDASNSAG